MSRWDWMAVRAYLPAVFALVVAFVSSLVLSRWQASPYLAPLASSLGWVPYAALAAGGVHGLWVTVRLWRAQYGVGLLCECGGLLGAERRGRWGDLIRTCRACGRHWKSGSYR
ncbi:hypothetical protein H1235_01980 [Pseudoxanthomonas sp. NC8]|nr:hypothetical protein H1235_01980 [Pseudoxanthomonas sp. NC8]